ncbi:hypothetical protein Tco_0170402, partial [Tanacetum coccineum]
YLLYGPAGVRVVTAAGGRSYKESSRRDYWQIGYEFTDLEAVMMISRGPADRLCGSYWSGYGFYCLPYSILFVIAAGIIGP